MTYEESKQKFIDMCNKCKILGIDIIEASIFDYGWYSNDSNAKISMIVHDNHTFIFIPDGLYRDKDSCALHNIIEDKTSFKYEHKHEYIKILGKCPKDASILFCGLKIKFFDLSELDMSETTMLRSLFLLANIDKVIFGNIKNAEVTEVVAMFASSDIKYIDNFELNTALVTDFSAMFEMTDIHRDLANIKLDTSNAKTYDNMYADATIHADLDVSNFHKSMSTTSDMFREIIITPNNKLILNQIMYEYYKNVTEHYYLGKKYNYNVNIEQYKVSIEQDKVIICN